MTPQRRSTLSPHPDARFILLWVALTILIAVLINTGLGFLRIGVDPRVGTTTDFVLKDLSDKSIRLGDYRGRPVLVNLWASWCIPCRDEMPDLIVFHSAHQKEGLVVLAINTLDESNAAKQFAQENALPFTVLYDPSGTVQRLLRADGLPSTFLIDRAGIVRFAWMGQISPAVLNQQVSPLLAE